MAAPMARPAAATASGPLLYQAVGAVRNLSGEVGALIGAYLYRVAGAGRELADRTGRARDVVAGSRSEIASGGNAGCRRVTHRAGRSDGGRSDVGHPSAFRRRPVQQSIRRYPRPTPPPTPTASAAEPTASMVDAAAEATAPHR